MDLKDKRVLVTGGSSGIGLALSEALVERGAIVFSFDKAKPKKISRGVTHFTVNVADGSQIKAALSQIPGTFDVLVNNAGVIRRGTLFDTTEEEFDLLFDINVKGSWLMLKHARPHLADNATIVQMSSGHALSPRANPGIYTLTKKTVLALAEILALTCSAYVVKIICPGPVDTPLVRYGRTKEELKRIKKAAHKPDYVAEHIVELLESEETKLLFDENAWDYYFE